VTTPVGSVSIQVTVDATDFSDKLRGKLAAAMTGALGDVSKGINKVNKELNKVDTRGVDRLGDSLEDANEQLSLFDTATQSATRSTRDNTRTLDENTKSRTRNSESTKKQRVELDAFQRSLIKQLDSIKRNAEIKLPLTVEGERARQQMRHTVDLLTKEAHGTISFDAEIAAGQRAELKAEVEALERGLSSTIHKKVEIDVDKRGFMGMFKGGGGGAGGLAGLAGGAGGAAGSVGDLGGSLGKMGGMGGSIGAIAPMIIAIGGAASAAAGMVGGLVIGLAALAGPAVAGIATVAIGLQGVGDAFTAVSDAQESAGKDAATQSKAIASAVRAQESAERGVITAKRASLAAEKDLTKARRDATEQLEDLQLAVRGAALSEKDAALSLKEAQQELASLGSGGEVVTDTERERALLRVEQATLGVAEAQESANDVREQAADAERKGVEGADNVVAAKDRLVTANEGVVTAEAAAADAALAVADAQSQSSAASDKAAQALADLSPAAASFVMAMQGIKPVWDEFQNAIQESMFAGLDESISRLATTALPALQDSMSGVGTSINNAAQGFADFFSRPETLDALNTIIGSTSVLIDGLMSGMPALTQGFLDFGVAAAPSMQVIGEALGSVAAEVGKMFEQLANSGQLTDILSGFASMVAAVGPLLGDLMAALADMAVRVLPSVQPMLDALGQAFVNMAPGLGEFGRAFLDVLSAAMPPLGQLVGILGGALAGALDALVPAFAPLGEALVAIFNALAPILPMLGETLAGIVIGLAPLFTNLANALAPIIAMLSEQLIGVVQTLTPVLVDLSTILGEALAEALNTIAPMFPLLVDSVAQLLYALLPLLPELMRMGTEILPILADAIVQTLPIITDLINMFTWLVNNVIVPLLIPIIRGLADEIRQMGEIIGVILAEGRENWEQFKNKIVDVWENYIRPAWDQLKAGIEAVKIVIDTVVDAMGRKWDELKAKFAGPVNFFINTVYNDGIKKAWDAVGKFIPLPEAPTITPIAGYAKGAVLPGYTPGRDVHDFYSPTAGRLRLSGGEAVMVPEWTRAVGPATVHAWNAAARSGGVGGARRAMGMANGGVVGFADGGIINSIVAIVKKYFPAMTITSTTRSEPGSFHDYSQAKAVDFSDGGNEGSPGMDAGARFFYKWWGNQLAELIHWPLAGWQNVDEGKPFDFGAATNAGHRNHVHVASHGELVDPNDPDPYAGALQMVGSGKIQGGSKGWAWVRDKAADVIEKILSPIKNALPDGPTAWEKLPKSSFEALSKGFTDWIRGESGKVADATEVPPGSGVERFRGLVEQLLAHYNLGNGDVNRTLRRMDQESGGDVDIVNDWDENWVRGTPSVGLMQVIGTTYRSHKDPFFDRGPYLYGTSIDPSANISASMRYALATYGSLAAAYDKSGGYDAGGLAIGRGVMPKNVIEPERVLSPHQTQLFEALVKALEMIGFSVPDFTARPVATPFQEGGGGIGPGGELISDTTSMIERTSTSSEQAAVARQEQLMSVLNQVASQLTEKVLVPTFTAAFEAGIASATTDQVLKGLAADIARLTGQSVSAGVKQGATSFDEGGVWHSGTLGLNSTGRDEFVLHPTAASVWNAQPLQQMFAGDKNPAGIGADLTGTSGFLGAFMNLLIGTLLEVIGLQIEVRDTLTGIAKDVRAMRAELLPAFEANGELISDTSALIERTETNKETEEAERLRIIKEIIGGTIKFIVNEVIIPMISSLLTSGIQALTTGIGGAIGSAIAPGVGTAAGAAIGNVVGAAVSAGLAGIASIFTGILTAGIAGLVDAVFDEGGVAIGAGFIPKGTLAPERVLSPHQTQSFDRLVDAIERGSRRTVINAPFTVSGGRRGAEVAHDRLLTLLNS
jgi:phage-related protein